MPFRPSVAPTLLLPALLASAAALAGDAAPAPDVDPASRAFAAKVQACEKAMHQSPHPIVAGFTIEHAVHGQTEGRCIFSQTMPAGMRLECALSEQGRAGLAHEFREMAQGRMSGSTGEQAAWTRECGIILPDGKRLPVGPA